MDANSIMRLKDEILDELLEDLDNHESEKLRPQAASLEIGVMKPGMGDEMGGDDKDPGAPPCDTCGTPGCDMHGGDDSDDDLRAALDRYSKD